jgi:hypothetical protein
MKSKPFIVAVAMLSLAISTQARAQSGIVGWVAVSAVCPVDTKSAAHKTSFGTVSFSGTASGNINMTCIFDGTTRINPQDVNAFGLIFNNDNGVVGGVDKCSISATFGARSNSTGVLTLLAAFSTAGHSYSGFTTVDPIALGAPIDFDHNTYFVTLNLHRIAGATCNPSVWVTFAEEIIQ